MSNLNNTVSTVAVAASQGASFMDTASKPESTLDPKAMPYGKFAMREIVKGLRATESGNKSNVIHHTGQVLETLARIMRDNRDKGVETVSTIKDGKSVPAWVETAMKDTLRQVIIAMVKQGDAPYLNCGVTLARIKAMPRNTAQERNLWAYQCRRLADATLFLDGQVVEKPKGVKYLPESMAGAKAKEYIGSLSILRNYTNKVVSWIYSEHADVIREFAFRQPEGEAFKDLDAADMETVARLIETRAPGGMSTLANAFRGKPAKSDDRTPIQKLLESFAKLSAEDRATFLNEANAKHESLNASAAAAEASVNKAEASTDYDDLGLDDGEAEAPAEVAHAA